MLGGQLLLDFFAGLAGQVDLDFFFSDFFDEFGAEAVFVSVANVALVYL